MLAQLACFWARSTQTLLTQVIMTWFMQIHSWWPQLPPLVLMWFLGLTLIKTLYSLDMFFYMWSCQGGDNKIIIFTITLILSNFKHSTHSYTIYWFRAQTLYYTNIRWCISIGLTPSSHKKCPTMHCSLMVQSLSRAFICLTPLFLATWLNDRLLHAATYPSSYAHASHISVAMLLLPHNFKIAFTLRVKLYYKKTINIVGINMIYFWNC